MRRQFTVSRPGQSTPPEGFRLLEANGWILAADPRLPIATVTAGNVFCGYLLGDAIDPASARVLEGTHSAPSFEGDLDAWIEEVIYSLSGSFAFLFVRDLEARFYVDPAASLSAVYQPAGKLASTPMLLLGELEYDRLLNHDARRDLEVEEHGWFPAGLTAHDGVHRTIPNHYIDLNNGKPVRHWPLEKISPPPLEEALEMVAASIRTSVQAVDAKYGAIVGLTAGNETRMILASLRPLATEVQFATIAAPGAEMEVEIARRLSRRFGLHHRELEYVEATGPQQSAWRVRVGHAIGGALQKMHPSMFIISGRCFVGGAAGEVGRGFLWLGATSKTKITAGDLLTRLKLRHEEKVLHAVEEWLAGTPEWLDSLTLLDLAYLELRVGSWAAVQSAYPIADIQEIWPLNSREAIAAMMSLPVDVRRGDRLGPLLVERKWPELLSVPINRYGDWRDKTRLLQRACRQPKQALAKLRQIGRLAIAGR